MWSDSHGITTGWLIQCVHCRRDYCTPRPLSSVLASTTACRAFCDTSCCTVFFGLGTRGGGVVGIVPGRGEG